MSLTLSKLESIIDNTIENELHTMIICDREIASIVEEYCDEYDLDMLHNVIDEWIPYEHRNSGYAIVINCLDGEYEYYIDFYDSGNKIVGNFDEIHIIGKEFGNGKFDWHNNKLRCEKGVEHGDMIVSEDDMFDYIDEKCTDCCLDCENSHIDNCDIYNCGCDECFEYDHDKDDKDDKESDTFTFETDIMDDTIICTCEDCMENTSDEQWVDIFTNAILYANGCPECVGKLVNELANLMMEIGWNDHQDYIRECNEG